MDRITIDYPGHAYVIEKLDGGGEQLIHFVRRPPFHEPMPGILIQDLLRVCIDRVKTLNKETPAPENEQVLYHLRMALVCQETRALRRKIELGKLPFPEHLALGEDGHFLLTGTDQVIEND